MITTPHDDATATDVLDGAKAFLTINVNDLEASIHWYSQVFGCAPLSRGVDASLDGDTTKFALFSLAGMRIFLSEYRAASMPPRCDPHSPTLVFMTGQPLGRIRRELARRGALFRDDEVVDGFPADADGVRAGRNAEFLWCYDPDGNKLEFCRTFATAKDGAAGGKVTPR